MKLFSSVSARRPKKNKFDLSHERKMSLNMGKLVPMMVQEIVPGDSFRVQTEIMMRFAPLLAPVMHRINVFTHYFFVPNRLVWSEWEDFITGGREGTSEPVVPHVEVNDATKAGFFGAKSLADYMGLPVMEAAAVSNGVSISMLPFRAYQLIYDEYYRDQNLQASLDISLASGAVSNLEATKLTTMRDRAWEKDYFTSALPWAQRGSEIMMPIEGTADVSYLPESDVIRTSSGAPPLDGAMSSTTGHTTVGGNNVRIENIDEVSFGSASTTINELRRSVRLQEWLEKNARGGARYVEQILSHFGVVSSDARLQRPEYLGGGKTPCVISEVLSTYQDPAAAGEPQGNMAGHGVSVGTSNGFKRTFEEHGFVIGIMSVLPKTAYQQGIPKMFRRFDKFDHFWPEFAQIGEQEIKVSEIYYNQASASGVADETFGYQSRYAEYKFAPSTVHGEMRDSLSYWQMGRIFDDTPVLNESFVASDPTNRIFAVTDPDVDHLYCQLYNRVDALRPMPYFGTPTL